ncbi:MAG: hypothetical protein ACREEQ_06035, partial [Caulobacteraceae bacterium]
SRAALAAGVEAMRGARLYIAGADLDTAPLANVGLWDTLDDARRMDRFQPMRDLGRRGVEAP